MFLSKVRRMPFEKMALIVTVISAFFTGCSVLPEKDAEPDTPYWAPALPLPKPKPTSIVNGSLFSVSNSRSLFEDRLPFQVGDILTVRLEERTQSQKSSGTTLDKNSSASMANPLFLGQVKELGLDMEMDRKFQGKANSTMGNSLVGDITVSVAEVYSNGVLRLVGEKWLRLNQGDEYIRIEGMVRPEDVSPDNVVMSMRLANARIVYSGAGSLNDSNDPGWLNRFFNSPIMPI